MTRTISRRNVLRVLATTGVLEATGRSVATAVDARPQKPVVRETYRALVDAVIPETPELAEDRGAEHRPGGTNIGLDQYFVEFLNELLTTGVPGVGHTGNARLAEAIGGALDAAAIELLARGENETPPTSGADDGGTFARLSRRDRIRAITLFEEKEFDTEDLDGPLLEADGGLLAQLLVGFVSLLYYSEWEGYEDIARPPSKRTFRNDVTAWRQVEYPGLADGYAALRGYLRLEGSVDGVELRASPGEFCENDYDTSEYEDPYPEGTSSDDRASLPARNEKAPLTAGEFDA